MGAALDYVPDYLPVEVRQQLHALASESRPEPAPLEVSEYLIRHWCETLEDGNPLYLDDAYARSRGFHGLVAPPGAVMTTFSMHYRWPWPAAAEDAPARHIHYAVKELVVQQIVIISSF